MTSLKISQKPKVSIGIPVYNGSNYLAKAVDSILNQTFSDFELLIQDNASTDETEAICRAYMEKDPRVKYIRNSENIGAAENFNRVLERARGKYFKWAAHDDYYAPTFLLRCVDILDKDPTVILCTGETELVNDDGSTIHYNEKAKCYVSNTGAMVGRMDPPHRAEGPTPVRRFWDILVNTMRSFEIFGLVRKEALTKTALHGSYLGSDKVLLAEIALLGRFHVVPEVLFYRRCHTSQYSRLTHKTQNVWMGDHPKGLMSVRIRKLIPGYFHVVTRSPIGIIQKLLCYGSIGYRFIAPITWSKEINPGRYTDINPSG